MIDRNIVVGALAGLLVVSSAAVSAQTREPYKPAFTR
jgi:hypothetical protein